MKSGRKVRLVLAVMMDNRGQRVNVVNKVRRVLTVFKALKVTMDNLVQKEILVP